MKKDAKNKYVLKDMSEYDKAYFKILGKNAKAKYILICGLRPDEYNRISGCTTAKQIWETLAIIYKKKNMDTLEKNKGIKVKSIALKEYDSVESALDNRKLTKNFKRYFKEGKRQNKKGTSRRCCSNYKSQTSYFKYEDTDMIRDCPLWEIEQKM